MEHERKWRWKRKSGGANGRWGEQWGGAHHEESRVHHSPGCGDDLPSTSVERLLSDDCIQDFKLDISDSWGQQKHWVMVALRRKITMHNADDGGWWSISSSSGTTQTTSPQILFFSHFQVILRSGKKKLTYAHHREAPPWSPTGSPEQCCLWLSRAAPCPPRDESKDVQS